MSQQYTEYREVTDRIDKINELAAKGWQVVHMNTIYASVSAQATSYYLMGKPADLVANEPSGEVWGDVVSMVTHIIGGAAADDAQSTLEKIYDALRLAKNSEDAMRRLGDI